MRLPLIAGNWKMNLHQAEALALAHDIVDELGSPTAEVAVFPPFPYLGVVGAVLSGSPVALGAQNVCHEANGAFTGEVSASMLLDLGCRYVIVGHSERRQFFGERDGDVALKAQAALVAGLTPIVCVGELLAERESGRTQEVVRRQLAAVCELLSAERIARSVLAYEPVWAIGTGKVATPEQAEEVHADLRNQLAARYNAAIAQSVRILYGGSVKSENAASLLGKPNVDGALVGGASLKAREFLGIVSAA